MRAIATVMLLATLAFVCGCEQQYQENWDRLHEGMNKTEVEDLLGKPSSKIDARRTGNDVDVAFDRWQYGDNLSTLATGALFPGEAPDRVWVVYFDDRGLVIESRRPVKPY